MKMQAFLLWLSLCLSGQALAAGPVAQVTHLSGLLTARHQDGSSKVLALQSDIAQGDTLVTEKNTYARIKFIDEAEVVLRPGTQLTVSSYAYERTKPEADNVLLSMLKGGMRAVTGLVGKRNKAAVNFKTPTTTIGIRGTHFGMLFCQASCDDVQTVSGQPPEDGLYVDVTKGAIMLSNEAGSTLIDSGQFGFVRNSTSLPLVVPAQLGVQVTMPTSISKNNDSGVGSGVGVGKSGEGECVAQ